MSGFHPSAHGEARGAVREESAEAAHRAYVALRRARAFLQVRLHAGRVRARTEGGCDTLPRLGSRVRIPSSAPREIAGQPPFRAADSRSEAVRADACVWCSRF